MKKLSATLIFLVLLISACAQQENTSVTTKSVEDVCIKLCNSATQDLSNGPCLGNPISEYSDWVCDVAHSPRQPVDNLPENQCSAYREGRAHHFVEVDENCSLIRAV